MPFFIGKALERFESLPELTEETIVQRPGAQAPFRGMKWGEEEMVRMTSGRWAEPDPTRYDRDAMQTSLLHQNQKGWFSHFRSA